MTAICRCVFIFDRDECLQLRSVRAKEGIGRFRDGFWLNRYFELASASDCKYWISPSAIQYIEKETPEDRG